MSLELMRNYADELERSNIGYDQGDRFSFNPPRDGKSVVPNRECDCSSSCASIARAGGFPLDTNDPIYTGNFKQKFVAAGGQAIGVSGKTLSQLIEMLKDGDFLIGPGHIVFAYTPTKWWSAENDEYGRSSGGRAGDQTGIEARFRSPYHRSRGWQWILRIPGPSIPTVPTVPPLAVTTPRIEGVEPRAINWQDPSSEFNKIVQEIVGEKADGIRGPRTISGIKRLQARLGSRQDGVFGPNTAEQYLLSLPNMYRGRGGLPTGGVKLLQWIVRSRVDGSFGGLTEADVKSAQVWAGLAPDGNVGVDTKIKITR